MRGVTTIAAGWSHTVALKYDGSVVEWGGNQTAVPVAAQSGVTAIAAGNFHTFALKNDGSVVAWGSLDQTAVPAGLTGVTAIAEVGENDPSLGHLLHTVALIGTVPLLPSLNARPNGNELILSWSTNAAAFTLQSTLNLTPPVTWMDSTKSPALIGAQFTVTNTLTGSGQFYRLRKP